MINVFFDDRQDVMEITKDNEDAIKNAVDAVLTAEGLNGDFEVSVSFVRQSSLISDFINF